MWPLQAVDSFESRRLVGRVCISDRDGRQAPSYNVRALLASSLASSTRRIHDARAGAMDLAELFQQGGPLMWAILAASIVGVGVFFERLWSTQRSKVLPRAFVEIGRASCRERV